MRKIAILPALLTLGNGVCGFAAIALASRIGVPEFPEPAGYYFTCAGWLILLAMVFDMLDGHVARLSRTASKFGGELDSLCDAISFGIAPAFLLLKMGPGWSRLPLHEVVAGIAALYMSCALLRLARFNVDNTPDPSSHKRFKGLPSPGAAGCLATLAIFRGSFVTNLSAYLPKDFDTKQFQENVQQVVELLAPLVALVVALLMVSRVPYPHVTQQVLRGRRHSHHLIQLLLTIFIFVMVREVALLISFWGYCLGVPLWVMLHKNVRASADTHNQVTPEHPT